MKEGITFLAFASKVLSKTKRVLDLYGVAPEVPQDADYEAYLLAMIAICREQGRDSTGIDDLRQVIEVLDTFRLQRNKLSSDQLLAGRESAARYDHWLSVTFLGM
jgi:hypothetical protein